MEWRTIPGLEAYEISRTGRVRRCGSHYVIQRYGQGKDRIRLCIRGRSRSFAIADLKQLAFASSVQAPVVLSPKPAKGSVDLRIKRQCAQCRADFLAEPGEKQCYDSRAQCREIPRQEAKKRFCVVCGCVLPQGYWRRCPEHAFSDNVHTEEDFGAGVVR